MRRVTGGSLATVALVAVLAGACGGDAPAPAPEEEALFSRPAPTAPARFDIDSVPTSDRVAERRETPATNQYAVVADGSLWLPHPELGTVSRVDPETMRVTATVRVGQRARPDPPPDLQGLAAGPAGIWATQALQRAVVRIDPTSNAVVDRIEVGAVPYALALDGSTLWVTDFEHSTVTRVDLDARRVVARIDAVPRPTGVAVGGGSVWVAEHRLGKVARIDPGTNRVTAELEVPGRLENLAFGHGAVWAATNDGRAVAAIDPATSRVARIPVDGNVFGVAVAEDAVWAAVAAAEGYLVRIDPRTGEVLEKVRADCAFGVAALPGAVWALSDRGCVQRVRTPG